MSPAVRSPFAMTANVPAFSANIAASPPNATTDTAAMKEISATGAVASELTTTSAVARTPSPTIPSRFVPTMAATMSAPPSTGTAKATL